MTGASAATRLMLLALLAALALGGCDDGGDGGGDGGPTSDVAPETDGGDDDAGTDMSPELDMAPDPEPDMATDLGPDMAREPDMAMDLGPDMAPDLGPDMAPDAQVGDLELTVESPADGDVVNQNPLPVTGTVTVAAVVTVNGVEAEVGDDLTWRAEIEAPDGELLITVSALGADAVEPVEETLTVTVDATPPPLLIVSPTDGATVVTDPQEEGDPDPTVEVCIESEPGAELAIMGEPVAIDEAGGGCGQAALPRLAANRVVATATDAAGNETRAEVFVNRREGVRDSDDDGDGLSLADEIEVYGTDPDAADSDEDGLDDGPEVLEFGTDPQNRDSDDDGLTDGLEINEYGSNPLVVDTDGGGISDGQEVQFGTDPVDPSDDRVPLPITLTDGGGFDWDINQQAEVVDGTGDAYDTGQRLSFGDGEDEFTEWPGADGAAFELDERQLRIGPEAFGGLIVDRKVYVPEDGQFARFLDLFTNPGGEPVEVLVRISGNMGSDGGTVLAATSDDVEGEPIVFGPEDDWVVSDDADAGGDPTVAHVFSGAAARVEPSAATFVRDDYTFDFPLVVPAGRTVALMTFQSQNADRAGAIAQAGQLVLHPIEALAGMTIAEQLAVVNFHLLDDTDDDGLPDFREVELGTDPANPDTDGDALLDLFEVENGFDPLAAGEQGLDPDEDGLDNLAEQGAGTDPLAADPDGDGVDDPDELAAGTNPNHPDTDSDGLNDGDELNLFGTDPLLRDTDGGGRSDREELVIDLTDPLDPEDDLAEPPVQLFDGEGFLWDILGDGSVDQGTSVAEFNPTFDRAAGLTLNGIGVPAQAVGRRLQAGREIVFGESEVGELQVTRQAYVPADAQFARFVDVIRNPGEAEVQVTAGFTVDMGGFTTRYVDDSDGDGELTPADDWWIAFDQGFNVRPVVAAIFSDDEAAFQPAAANRNFSILDWRFDLVVPAGGEVRLMHLLAQHAPGDVEAAGANLQALLARPDAIFAGLTPEERLSIVNLDTAVDTDGDGLADIEEIPLGTDPESPDTDGDGLLDGFEVRFGFDPLAGGEQVLDGDEDGLDNLAEQAFGSDPTLADADGDGLDDSGERDAATNPFDADSDADGLTDPDEIALGTDPNDEDSDDGGRLDGPEVTLDGTDPFDPTDDLVPVELTHSLRDGADFLWDITSDGAISNGTRDAYDGGLDLLVGGDPFPVFDEAFLGFGAREANIGPAQMGELVVNRRIYVPEGAQFARFIEVLTNPTGGDIEVDVTLDSNLGSDGGTQLVADSSGDDVVGADDNWFVTDDGNLELGDPSVLHLYSDDLAPVQPSVVGQDGDGLIYTFPVTVPAGETIYVMHFAAQHDTPADAAANLDLIFPFGDVTLAGLRAEERRRVVNLRLAPDDDGDGIPNEDEEILGTDPANPDTDGDGLLDGYEVDNGFDPLVGGDGEADPDGDGLNNLGEFDARTDPTDPDTDGDGLNDLVEVEGPTDPRSADTDGDQLLDGEEIDLGTDPLVVDTDEGGTSDGEEILRFGTDPLNGADDIVGVGLPYTLIDGGQGEWDVNSAGATNDGGIVDGAQDAYDTAFTMVVDGVSFPGQDDAVLQLDGQQLTFGPVVMSGMRVSRRVYASPDAAFVRYVETFTNPTGAAIQAEVDIGGNLGSDSDTVIIDSSTGDGEVTVDDDWWTSDDDDVGLDPKLLFVVSDEAAPVQPTLVEATRDSIDYDYVIDVPPGQTVHLMHFAAQAADRDGIIAARDVVLAFGPETLVGLTGDEQLSILNLVVAEDADGDRLTDEDELVAGTDPANPDTDGDGLLDGFEVRYGFDPLVEGEAGLDGDADGLDNIGEQDAGTRPDLADSDGDGLTDGAEVDLGTSPLSVDTDGDGLDDGREPELGTNPLLADTDGDGLDDSVELDLRIDPLNEDSDGDGALDGPEVEFGLDPRDAEDAALDPDEDTVPSGVEVNLGSDPFDADTDDDGLDDGLEINALGTDPANADTDGGGRSDGDEQLIDFTDPLDPEDDVPAVDLPVDLVDGAGFVWDVQPNGTLTDGTRDAYDAPTFLLSVGLDTFPGQDNAFTSDDGREIFFGPAEIGGLDVSRRVYVPEDGQFIRYLEVFDNPGDAQIEVQVRITGDLGSDFGTDVIGDASGDLLVGPEDTWFASDDGDGEFSDPALGFACFGTDAAATPATLTLADGEFTYGYDVVVEPGARVTLMHFAGQYDDADSATAGAAALAEPDAAALMGIDAADGATVVNFSLAPAN